MSDKQSAPKLNLFDEIKSRFKILKQTGGDNKNPVKNV